MSDPIKAGDFVCDADGRDLHPFKVGKVLSGPHGDVLVLMTADGERSVGSAPIDKMVRLDVKDEIASDAAVDGACGDWNERELWSKVFCAALSGSATSSSTEGTDTYNAGCVADAAIVEWRKRWGAP